MSARILVVDDLLPNIKLLQAKLESEFYEVTTALSGGEALNSCSTLPPDIILLDVMMPEMDGFETCRRIKDDPKTSDIPVVMVTALSDAEDRVQGLQAGADDFLTKPINDLALFARIRSLVRLKGMTDELKLRDKTGEILGVEEVNSDLNLEDIDACCLIIDDDSNQAKQVEGKLASMGMSVDIAGHGNEAIPLAESKNYDLIIVSTQLDDEDGLNICSHLRSLEETRTVPLLIIIEDDDTDLLIKGLDMGINDYLITPIDVNEVEARASIQIKRKRYQDALKANQDKNLEMAVIDGLTNTYNRRYFDTHMAQMLKSAMRSAKPMAVLMLDIDYFKRVNDEYGHQAGDDILRQLPKRIGVRPTDLVVRYGGEEFSIVMPDTTAEQAIEVAERIRRNVAAKPFTLSVHETGELGCTVSIGVASDRPGDTVASLVQRADQALYHAKENGRNKVAVANNS